MRRIFRNITIGFLICFVSVTYGAVVLWPLCNSDSLGIPIVAALIGSGVAIVTGIVALIKDFIWEMINRPRLVIRFFPFDKRDCHATTFNKTATKAHYFRFRVENAGWRISEEVEVNLEEVRRFENGQFVVDTDFMPLRLYWSHWRNHRYEISIPPGTYRHCDFGFVIDPTATSFYLHSEENGNLLFWFDFILRPNTGRTSLLPGRYQVKVSAFGKNVRKASLTVELEWRGRWYDEFEEMLKQSFLPKKCFETA